VIYAYNSWRTEDLYIMASLRSHNLDVFQMFYLQILSFNIPLMLYLARCLDLTVVSSHRDKTQKVRLLVWLLDHSVFLIIVGLQVVASLSPSIIIAISINTLI